MKILASPGSFVCCFILSIAVSGCATSGTGEPFSLRTPSNQESIIYHYRVDEGFRGSAIQWDVLSNNEPLTRIGPGGYFTEVATPGQKTYRTRKNANAGVAWIATSWLFNALEDFEEVIVLDVEEGRQYFLRYDFVTGKTHPAVTVFSREQALSELQGLSSFPAAIVSDD